MGALLVFLPSGFQRFFPYFHEIICQFCALFVLLPAGEGLIVEPFIPLIASSQSLRSFMNILIAAAYEILTRIVI